MKTTDNHWYKHNLKIFPRDGFNPICSVTSSDDASKVVSLYNGTADERDKLLRQAEWLADRINSICGYASLSDSTDMQRVKYLCEQAIVTLPS